MNANCIILHDAGVVFQLPSKEESGYREIASTGRRLLVDGRSIRRVLEHYGVLAEDVAGGVWQNGKRYDRSPDDTHLELEEELYVIGPKGYSEGIQQAIDVLVIERCEPGLIEFRVYCGRDTGEPWHETITYSGNYSIFWSK